jgi:SAM-dependent methyltransferase
MYHGAEKIAQFVPEDSSQQVNLTYFTDKLLKSGKIDRVLDLGCGRGNSVEYFRKVKPDIKWVGLDIESSPEVNSRMRSDCEFHTYDGVHIPFDDNSFDLIYCNQVFEHVEKPAELLLEVKRVLKPGGSFVGSVSHLEPFHSLSFWNFTPYGFAKAVEAAGLKLGELRPGIDSLTIIVRRMFGGARFFSRYWVKESPLNKLISFACWLTRKTKKRTNYIKLLFCGQFCFFAYKES